MLSVSSIYQAFRKSNQSLTTTQRFALVTVATLTGHYGWLKLTPVELGEPLGVERRTAYRLIAWMKDIGFLLPVDVRYDRKQVNHVFLCGLPLEPGDVDTALPHIQKHFTVTNRQKTLTVIPTVTVSPLTLPGLPALAGVILPGAKLHPAGDPLHPRKIVTPVTQIDAPKRVTRDTDHQTVSPMTQTRMPICATGDTPCNFVPRMTLTPSGPSDEFSAPSTPVPPPPYEGNTATNCSVTPITSHAMTAAASPKSPAVSPAALTAAPSAAILGTGETRDGGSQRSVSRVDLTHTTTPGGDGDHAPAPCPNRPTHPLADGVRVSGEKADQRAPQPPRPTQRSLLPGPDLDPAVDLVARWLQITHAPRPAEPELTRDYLQPARELLALTAGDVDDALRRLNARRTRFIAAGYKSARKLSTIGGAILREAEAEQIAARTVIDPFAAHFALPVPPQTTY